MLCYRDIKTKMEFKVQYTDFNFIILISLILLVY